MQEAHPQKCLKSKASGNYFNQSCAKARLLANRCLRHRDIGRRIIDHPYLNNQIPLHKASRPEHGRNAINT